VISLVSMVKALAIAAGAFVRFLSDNAIRRDARKAAFSDYYKEQANNAVIVSTVKRRLRNDPDYRAGLYAKYLRPSDK